MLPLLCELLLFTVAAVSGDENYYLSWPEKYTLIAIKTEINLDIIESQEVWKTNTSSRIDYNNGTVKSIRKKEFLDYPYGAEFEIRPMFTNDGINIMVVNITTPENKSVKLQTSLPDEDDFNFVGYESIDGQETVKFYYTETDEGKEYRRTMWAMYDNITTIWTPVRYQRIIYNEWLGYIDSQLIIDYYSFSTDFDESVFDIADPHVQNEYTEHTMASEAVTKHLFSIDPENEQHVNHVFDAFKIRHSKKYRDESEHEMRKRIFQDNIRLIKSTNQKNLGYKLAVNQFADLTPEEMKRHTGILKSPDGIKGSKPFPYTASQIKEMEAELPDEYDMRLLGYVSSIKNQGDCGSCWTFASTAVMEGALARQNGGNLLSLSNQALLDCAWPFGSNGCHGASPLAALEWLKKYGIPTTEEYGTYRNKEDFCRINNMTLKFPIKDYTLVIDDADAIKVAMVNHGPLLVCVHVSTAFTLYNGGVFRDLDCSPELINHGVTLVGYGVRDGDTYWIIKNSWGPDWGIDGYMLISSRDNACGAMSTSLYVEL